MSSSNKSNSAASECSTPQYRLKPESIQYAELVSSSSEDEYDSNQKQRNRLSDKQAYADEKHR